MVDAEPQIDWGEAIERHRGWLSTIVHARLADRQAAEDVIQEVALAAIGQTSRPEDPAKIAPWLYRIALRKVINHHRTTGRRRRLMEGVACSGLVPQEASGSEPGEWLVKQESESAVAIAMNQLAPSEKEILLLKYTEGWGYQELANHLGVSVKTIEYRLLKARKSLRANIERLGHSD